MSGTGSSIAISISAVALVISAANLYISQLRVVHSLRAVIVADSGQRTKYTEYGTAPFLANIIFINDGNRTESIVGARFLVATDGDVLGAPPVGPFVLKSGDSIVARSSSPISSNNIAIMKPNIVSSLSFEITFVEPNGTLATRTIDVGTIVLGKETGNATLEYNVKPANFSQVLLATRWPF